MTEDHPSLQFLSFFEKKLLFFCSLVFMASIGALSINIVAKMEKNQNLYDRQRVGIVSSINNELKIKNFDGPSWKMAGAREVLYVLDSLMTGPASSAVIFLDDGSEINLAADSLIILNKLGKQTELEVKQGTVAGKTGNLLNLAVYDQGKKMQMDVKDATFDLQAQDNGPLDFKIMRGNARIFNGQQTVDLGPAQSLRGSNLGLKPQAITLVSPLDKQVFLAGGPELEFRWQGPEEIKKFQFELSESSDFKKILFQQALDKKHLTYRLKQEGIFFWRAKALGEGEESAIIQVSDIRTVVTQKVEQPRALVPVLEEIKDNPRFKLVHFSWEGAQDRFIFSLKNSPNTAKNILAKELSDKNFALKLAKGVYYWQVEAINNNSLRSKSETLRLTVDDDTYLIKLLAPAANWKYFYEELNNHLTFQWDSKQSQRPSSYELLVATDMDFKNLIFHRKGIDTTLFDWPEFGPGSYFWQVRGTSAGVKIGSEIGRFQIYLKKELIPRINTREVNLKI